MSVWTRIFASVTTLLAAGIASQSAAQSATRDSGAYYDWSEEISERPSTWADYFRKNAKIVLGPERKLPNGVSWRLLIDRITGVPTPRVTWMPNPERLRAANRLLERVQGGEMLVVKHEQIRLRLLNDRRIATGLPPLNTPPVMGWETDLTYVGARLMSMMATAETWAEGHDSVHFVLRGLTFDLKADTITHVSECPGHEGLYGVVAGGTSSPQTGNLLFRYSQLLDLCDARRYREFISLVKRVEAHLGVHHLDPSASNRTKGCVEYPDAPVFQEDQEYILYLTFTGLAIQATGRNCPAARTADNPVIVPYRELAPLMTPGPLRDELLALPATNH